MSENRDPFDSMEWFDRDMIGLLAAEGFDMHRHFQCLMLSKGAIDDNLRNLLMRTAVSMVCLKQTKGRIKTDWCEGGLTTGFQHGGLEGFSGLKFECSIELEGARTVKATFIIGNRLLERFGDAAWYFEQAEKVQLKTSYFN